MIEIPLYPVFANSECAVRFAFEMIIRDRKFHEVMDAYDRYDRGEFKRWRGD